MFESGPWEHEEVVTRRGRRSGLAITVAVHSRALGPAAGGCRMRHYPQWGDAVADALRLSRGMTYKCAAAGLRFGGGKSVVAVPEGTELTAALRGAALDDLGEMIDSFGGSYLAGPDVGTGPDDMVVLRRATPHVFCLPEQHGGTGSSSEPTATGVLAALRAGAREVFGTESLSGRTVVVAGLGSVGTLLARELAADGARIVASDVVADKRRLAERSRFDWVDPADAPHTRADVLVPAAVGGVLDAASASRITARLVVGPANNQLTDDSVAERLAERGVVWVPDFVAGAGGVVYTLAREFDGLDHPAATARVRDIESTVEQLLSAARVRGTTPLHEAMALARNRLSPQRRAEPVS